jgi:Type II CAAX prenyl endopeptidase Rce1-like
LSAESRPLIPLGTPAKFFIVMSFLVLAGLFFFGLDYGDVMFSLVAIGAVMIGVIGWTISDIDKTQRDDHRSAGRYAGQTLKWVGIMLGAFAMLDAFVPKFFTLQFFGYPLAATLSAATISPVDFLSVGLVFTNAEAVMEELLWGLGLVNAVPKYSMLKGMPAAFFAAVIAGASFGGLHIPAYGFEWAVIAILGLARFIFTIGDYQVQDVLPSMISHAANNTLAWFATASVLVGWNFALLAPASPLQLVMLAGAVASAPLQVYLGYRAFGRVAAGRGPR